MSENSFPSAYHPLLYAIIYVSPSECTNHNLYTSNSKGGFTCRAACWGQQLMTLQEYAFTHFISPSKRAGATSYVLYWQRCTHPCQKKKKKIYAQTWNLTCPVQIMQSLIMVLVLPGKTNVLQLFHRVTVQVQLVFPSQKKRNARDI